MDIVFTLKSIKFLAGVMSLLLSIHYCLYLDFMTVPGNPVEGKAIVMELALGWFRGTKGFRLGSIWTTGVLRLKELLFSI